MAPSKILLEQLYPKVETAFSDKKNIAELEKIIGAFVDRNAESLSTIGPTKMILFTDREMDPVYKLVGTTSFEVKALKNKSPDIKSQGFTMAYPFNAIMPMIIRYFILTNNTSMIKMCTSYLAMSIYPLLFYKYFPYEPNENVMNYTVNNLSRKFKIKQAGNLFVAITETAEGACELHRKDLTRGYDIDVVQFILSLRTRLNSFLRKIANEFYKNKESGNYLNTEFESNDDENYREADSSMYAIQRIVDKVSLKLIVNGPNVKLISIAARNNQISVNELRNYIGSMLVDDNKDDIRAIIEALLVIFLFDKHNAVSDINSDKFLIYSLDIYKRSNTTDKNVLKIKAILDKWLERLGAYKKTQRAATINNFRRALYTFFVISIQYSNVN